MRIAACLMLTLSLALCGCPASNKTADKGGNPAKGDGAPADAKVDTSKPADFKMTAEEFHKDVKAAGNDAAKKYKDKIFEITGVVDHYGKNISNDVQMMLAVKGDILGIICFTTEKQPWDKADIGQTVKVRGAFPEFSFTPSLIKCTILEATGPKNPPISAQELAKAFDADPKKVQTEHNDKWRMITGTVADKKEKDGGSSEVTFKTDSKVKIVAYIGGINKEDAAQVKVGENIRLLGMASVLSDSVSLNMGMHAGPEKK